MIHDWADDIAQRRYRGMSGKLSPLDARGDLHNLMLADLVTRLAEYTARAGALEWHARSSRPEAIDPIRVAAPELEHGWRGNAVGARG